MDWRKLYFGKIKRNEIEEAIKDLDWQKLRNSLKGKDLEYKYISLLNYYNENKNKGNLRLLQVRLTNYVTALSRGGLIKPCDYCKGGLNGK